MHIKYILLMDGNVGIIHFKSLMFFPCKTQGYGILVDGIRSAFVRFADIAAQPVLVLPDDIHRAVCGAAINDKMLDIGPVLRADRVDADLKKLALIERGRNDRNFWNTLRRHIVSVCLPLHIVDHSGQRMDLPE